MIFLFHVKSVIENESAIGFAQFDLFKEKSAFYTEISLPVKTIERGRDVSGGTKILRNTDLTVALVRQLVQVAVVRTMFCQATRMP